MIDFAENIGSHVLLLAKINRVFESGHVELLFAGSKILCPKELLNNQCSHAEQVIKTLITEPKYRFQNPDLNANK